jgi:catechol 2,3-dioxygenase-like lactoylglutathione lyase family enzyme
MMATSPIASLSMVNLDCPDPRAMAAFYAAVLGWEVTYSEEEYAMITGAGTTLGFGRVEGWTPVPRSDTTSTCRRTTWLRPRWRAASWVPRFRTSSPARAGGECSPIPLAIRSA